MSDVKILQRLRPPRREPLPPPPEASSSQASGVQKLRTKTKDDVTQHLLIMAPMRPGPNERRRVVASGGVVPNRRRAVKGKPTLALSPGRSRLVNMLLAIPVRIRSTSPKLRANDPQPIVHASEPTGNWLLSRRRWGESNPIGEPRVDTCGTPISNPSPNATRRQW
jgi:hypothetical protein